MSAVINYIERFAGKRSTIRVERDARGIVIAFQRDGEGAIAFRVADAQARDLARMLNEAAADGEAR